MATIYGTPAVSCADQLQARPVIPAGRAPHPGLRAASIVLLLAAIALAATQQRLELVFLLVAVFGLFLALSKSSPRQAVTPDARTLWPHCDSIDRAKRMFTETTVRYAIGGLGERRTAEYLACLPDHFDVIHDVPLPSANIDHAVIDRTTNAWVMIDTKLYGQAPEVLQGVVQWDSPHAEIVDTCTWEAGHIQPAPAAILIAIGGSAEVTLTKVTQFPLRFGSGLREAIIPTYLVPQRDIAEVTAQLLRTAPASPRPTLQGTDLRRCVVESC